MNNYQNLVTENDNDSNDNKEKKKKNNNNNNGLLTAYHYYEKIYLMAIGNVINHTSRQSY